ncbi:unnamed protein product, partial [Schistocephalus solidus]
MEDVGGQLHLLLEWPADSLSGSAGGGRGPATLSSGAAGQRQSDATLVLQAWNVRSILDNPRSNRPERRTALVARELARYKVDIAALSETRFSEQGQLEEVGASYTFILERPAKGRATRRWCCLCHYNFFWSGWPKAERRDTGVAF